jgi:hypothetical protein
VQPGPDSAEWQTANRQQLVTIELQKKKVQGLERQARQRKHNEDAIKRIERLRLFAQLNDAPRENPEASSPATS